MSVPVALDDIKLTDLADLTGPPDEFAVLDELSATGASGRDVSVAGPVTADVIGRLVAAVVTAILREGLPAGRPLPLELGSLAAQLDTAVMRAWRDLDGTRLTSAAGSAWDGGAGSARSLSAGESGSGDAQLCTLFAVDIAGFTRPDRDDDIRRYLHEQLYTMLRKAFDGSDIPWTSCQHEDRGDGVLVVIPAGVCGLNLVGPLPGRLCGLVRRHNHVSRDAARIQLRAAAHFGLVEHDGHGFVGSDVNLLFRILDAPPLKQALAASHADLALILSDPIYRSFVCRHPSLQSPDVFKAVNFQRGQAEFEAWSHFPGTA